MSGEKKDRKREETKKVKDERKKEISEKEGDENGRKSSRGIPYLGTFFFISTRQQPFLANLSRAKRVFYCPKTDRYRDYVAHRRRANFSLSLYILFSLRSALYVYNPCVSFP